MLNSKLNAAGLALLVVCAFARSTPAQSKITVNLDQPGAAISPTLWGIFFEDINLSADGGIYPELVRNRSFEDSSEPEHWKLSNASGGKSEMTIESSNPLNTFNVHHLRVKADGDFTLENEGYWGMNVVKDSIYIFKMASRASDDFKSPITVKIVNAAGGAIAAGQVPAPGKAWSYYTMALTATDSSPGGRLQISAGGRGSIYLDMVSLMPAKTWKGHGLRTDLAEMLAGLHPSFMRFPGGNWIEGEDIAHMYHWKTTIGDIDSRTPLWNTWGYNTTQGLGYHEYLQLCEDLGAEPLFGINCGMTLGDRGVPLSQMGQWIEDALDAIEYANGPTNSVWGSMRAQAGHPAPFHLQCVEIGNENGGSNYWQRWPLLAKAIRQYYPSVKLIMTTSLNGFPFPPDPKPDIVDEHYYESPESFIQRADQYDKYDRNGPKIFVGEYAVTQHSGQGNLRAAIGEAAFMTGMERNSDVVTLASYAPLFVNVNHRAWNPDLISFDSSRSYGSPSYYVQQMFSANRGDVNLHVETVSPVVTDAPGAGMIGVGTWNTAAEFKDIKVTAPDGTELFASDFSQNADGWKMLGDRADWRAQGGVLRQSAEREFIRVIAGQPSWADYDLTLKARKLSGREGFLILFHIKDNDDRTWWNIGGWNNTQNALENGGTIDGKPGRIETGKWYDIRMEIRGKHIKCFLDGDLVHDVDYDRSGALKTLYACASRDDKSGDVIVKVVNVSAAPVETALDFPGAGSLSGKGRAIVLTSENPNDENSLQNPDRVSPKAMELNFQGDKLTWTFPGNSLTVLRLARK